MPQLNCSEAREVLGAYALGALDGVELDAVEQHLAVCADCSVALAEHQQTVGALALATTPVEPSRETRERLLASARVDAAPAPVLPAPTPLTGVRRRQAPSWALPLLSTAAVLLIVGVGVLGVLLTRAIDERDRAISTAELLSTYVSAGGHVVTLKTQPVSLYQPYNGKGSLLTAPGRDPVVVVVGCPKSGDYLTYWVWFGKGQQRVAAGKLTVGEDGSGWIALKSGASLAEFDTIGVTIELDNRQREDVLVAPLTETSIN